MIHALKNQRNRIGDVAMSEFLLLSSISTRHQRKHRTPKKTSALATSQPGSQGMVVYRIGAIFSARLKNAPVLLALKEMVNV